MSNYAKFMKEVISKKRKLEEYETRKDIGSFTIPCTIENSSFDKALCDLGASINLMPLSVFKKLGLEEVKPTTVIPQVADRSLTYPRGIIEDVLVKVDKFIFPADFVVLDMEEDQKNPLILGRPFLATRRALINVQEGHLTLRVNEEEARFNIYQAMKYADDTDTCHIIDFIDSACKDIKQLVGSDDKESNVSSKIELKQLPNHLRYTFLEDNSKSPVIISSSLTRDEEDRLLKVLREHKATLGWSIADIKGISPTICKHKILAEDLYKPSIEH
ncbi:uncharacterized protein LOC111404442 [Olea europaea var. sylvestris]|uniref:uncharacterized protein LOC111404442 n=1 Tax=Olea europaea var. sylvestris TaxID=158386 RepID=UPI000C1D7110|nr:uncharacterized protein LOC111404442 [Olea europaea var. sylvestris]